MTIDQPGAGERQRNLLPLRDVRRARDNRQLVLAGIDRRQNKPVGVRVSLDVCHVSDENLVPAGADLFDLFSFEPGHRHTVCEFFGGQSGLDVLGKPAHRCLHYSFSWALV
ncbi:MAG: hypothetical protein R2843_03755 [Thermomicrobiales bacterium]